MVENADLLTVLKNYASTTLLILDTKPKSVLLFVRKLFANSVSDAILFIDLFKVFRKRAILRDTFK